MWWNGCPGILENSRANVLNPEFKDSNIFEQCLLENPLLSTDPLRAVSLKASEELWLRKLLREGDSAAEMGVGRRGQPTLRGSFYGVRYSRVRGTSSSCCGSGNTGLGTEAADRTVGKARLLQVGDTSAPFLDKPMLSTAYQEDRASWKMEMQSF